jgi:hypothetical protein
LQLHHRAVNRRKNRRLAQVGIGIIEAELGLINLVRRRFKLQLCNLVSGFDV